VPAAEATLYLPYISPIPPLYLPYISGQVPAAEAAQGPEPPPPAGLTEQQVRVRARVRG